MSISTVSQRTMRAEQANRDAIGHNNAARAGGVVIRPAVADDLPAVVAILSADETGGHGDTTDPAAMPRYHAAFEAIVASPNDSLYVALSGSEVIGTFQFVLSPCLLKRGTPRALVEAVHVRPDQRGSGVGALMVGKALELAREAGAASLELTSNAKREDAHRFYERLGFVRSHLGFKRSLGERGASSR